METIIKKLQMFQNELLIFVEELLDIIRKHKENRNEQIGIYSKRIKVQLRQSRFIGRKKLNLEI